MYIIDQDKVMESVNMIIVMTLSFSELKDGDKAKSIKLSNLDDSEDSEEDNVQPVTIDDHNEDSSKEGKEQSWGAEEGSNSHTHYHDAKYEETSRLNLPKQREWSKEHSWNLILGDPDE